MEVKYEIEIIFHAYHCRGSKSESRLVPISSDIDTAKHYMNIFNNAYDYWHKEFPQELEEFHDEAVDLLDQSGEGGFVRSRPKLFKVVFERTEVVL